MDITTEVGIFLAYALGILGIYFFGKVLLVPLAKVLKLIGNSVLGGVILIVINIIGVNFGVFVPLNLLTAGIAGVLGVPGVICLVTYFNFC